MSKGKQQMRKFSTFKEAAQKIVIKKPWGVEVKDYKAGDPIPAGVQFKIFNATDTAKIDAYADSLDESADYQKKRFKEPYYMYNESKKVVENKMVGIISLPVGSKFIDDSFGGKRTLEVVKHGNDDVVHVKEVGTGRKFAYDASTPGGNKKVEKIEEGFLITGPSIEGKTFYVRSKDAQGTTFDRSNAFIFNSEKDAKDTIEKMKKAGYYTDKIEVIKESVITESKYYIKRGKKYFCNMNGDPAWGPIKDFAIPFNSMREAEKYMDKMGDVFPMFNYDYDIKVVSEGRIAKGYENLDAEERAKHLLSHPSSKYMNDLKSENITERAIRKAVKEMLGKPDKRDPQFIIDVNEEGEAPAATTTTAEVANPDLPLKLKEDVHYNLKVYHGKVDDILEFYKRNNEWLSNKTMSFFKKYIGKDPEFVKNDIVRALHIDPSEIIIEKL